MARKKTGGGPEAPAVPAAGGDPPSLSPAPDVRVREPEDTTATGRSGAKPTASAAGRPSGRVADTEKAAAMFALQVGGVDAATDLLMQLKRKLAVE